MSFLNYLHENHAVCETEIINENYFIEELDEVEDLFESIKTFKDVPNALKKVLVTAYKKAGEASSVKDLNIQSEGKITTKTAFQNALKSALNVDATVSGFVLEVDGKGVLAVTTSSMHKFNVYDETGATKPEHKDLPQTAAIKAIKDVLEATIEGGLSAAFKGKGIEIKAIHADKEREAKADARRDNTYDVRRKSFVRTELTEDERKRLIDKFAKKHITAKVDKLVKSLPEVLGDTDKLLKASLDRNGFEHKQIQEIADMLREVSNSLDAYRWASEDQRIRNFNGEVNRYLKDIKTGK